MFNYNFFIDKIMFRFKLRFDSEFKFKFAVWANGRVNINGYIMLCIMLDLGFGLYLGLLLDLGSVLIARFSVILTLVDCYHEN